MSGLDGGAVHNERGAHAGGLKHHQLSAAASPHLSSRQLAGQESPVGIAGNFQDLETLLDELGSPPVFQLGEPLPDEKFLPAPRIGDCPAAHNRALLDDEPD